MKHTPRNPKNAAKAQRIINIAQFYHQHQASLYRSVSNIPSAVISHENIYKYKINYSL